jgi:hypothetical protein
VTSSLTPALSHREREYHIINLIHVVPSPLIKERARERIIIYFS